MGKRLRRGGGRSMIMDRSKLIRRIKTLNLNSSPDPDIVIQRLRDQYPDYARMKLQPFSARLSEVLQYIRNGNTKPPAAGNTSSSSFSDGERSSRRKRGKEDVFEERLLRAESEHLRRLQVHHVASSPSESSDDSTSTSDDAAFEENIEPEFDVTKSMLRERYVKQSEQSVKKGKEEKNVEIEAVADEKRKIAISMKKGGGSGKEAPVVGLEVVGNDHRSNMVSGETGREGPRFQDLGGINMVLEDLMMEVIVPLCHPELPKRLGVRPMAGILLHGPPGCGKTKLAYAIANETGVPFYKISATEVVSGVSGCVWDGITASLLYKKQFIVWGIAAETIRKISVAQGCFSRHITAFCGPLLSAVSKEKNDLNAQLRARVVDHFRDTHALVFTTVAPLTHHAGHPHSRLSQRSLVVSTRLHRPLFFCEGLLEFTWRLLVTVLQTQGSFPVLVHRLFVIKSESMKFLQ